MRVLDGGVPLAQVVAQEDAADDVAFPLRGGGHGALARGRGWSPVPTPPLRVYRATTDKVGLLFPMLGTPELPSTGAPMGINGLSRAGFFVDVPRWVREGIVSNPNIILMGKPGWGKSGTIKALVRRSIGFGARAFIPGDLKEEYLPLLAEHGIEPVLLGPGMPSRVNALESGPLTSGWSGLGEDERRARFEMIRARWLVLLEALLDSLGVQVNPTVRMALSNALDELTGASHGNLRSAPDITVPEVWSALRDPSTSLVQECRFSTADEMRHWTRGASDGLAQLCQGSLRGVFDERTNIDLDWSAPINDVSLKRLKHMGDQVVGVGLTVMNSWTRAMTDSVAGGGQATLVVRDEVWRQMRLGAGAVKSLDSDLRLSRDERTVQIMALHKPSDLGSVGDAGSEAHAIAQDLWALCDTKILLAQEEAIAAELQEQLGLTPDETAQIRGWCWKARGRALWKVGDSSHKVATLWASDEHEMFNTNEEA